MRNARCVLPLMAFLLILALPAQAYETMPLRLGMDQWPPYEFKETTTPPDGIAYQATKTVLQEMGIKIRSVDMLPWGRGLDMLEHGEIDVLLSGVRTPEREKVYHYPDEPIITAQWRAFVHCHRTNPALFKSIASLNRKEIGTVRSYNYPREFMRRLDEVALLNPVNTDETNFRKLITGRLDVVLSDYLNGLWLLHELDLYRSICVTPMEIGSRPLYALFSKKTVNKDLVQRFSEDLKRFKQTRDYEHLIRKTRPVK